MSGIVIRWERRAVEELHRLPVDDRRRVVRAVGALAENPLRGAASSGRWKGLRRLRVGAHRVIYGYDGAELSVAALWVGHRREVYR